MNNDNIKIDFTITKKTFEIPNSKLNSFDSLIRKIRRFCKKLELPEPKLKDLGEKTYYAISSLNFASISLSEEYELNYNSITSDYSKIKEQLRPTDQVISEDVSVFELDVIDQIKPNNEWEILGIIDHVDGIISTIPDKQVPFELVPKDLTDSSHCDHCHSKRYRNKTIYVQNKDNNEIKRVGGSCISYYLGFDYERILNILSSLNMLSSKNILNDNYEWDDFGYSDGHRINNEPIVDVKDIINYFFWYATNKGYISRRIAEEKGIQSTSTTVILDIEYINNPPRKYVEEWSKFNDEYHKIINSYKNNHLEEVIKFIDENYKDNNFLINAKNALENGGIYLNRINYVISACSMYYGLKLAEDRKNQEKEENKKSNHIGTIGEKSTLKNLKIDSVSGFEGAYGWTNVYKLKDEKGNIYTKFGKINEKFITDESEVFDISKGAILSFVAEIKKHDVYNEVNQTILGRLSKIK